MNEVSLFYNMKRWLVIQGTQLLDLIFPIFNPHTNDPRKRYENLTTRLDEHFNLLPYYSSQVGIQLPAVLVQFEDRSSNSCFNEIQVTFNVYFQTLSPQDCKDCNNVVCNTPECILNFRQEVIYGLCDMVYNMGKDLKYTSFDGEPWQYPIEYDVTDESLGKLKGSNKDEILHFQVAFTLLDHETLC